MIPSSGFGLSSDVFCACSSMFETQKLAPQSHFPEVGPHRWLPSRDIGCTVLDVQKRARLAQLTHIVALCRGWPSNCSFEVLELLGHMH